MALTGLDIYKQLPKTNCKKCGFPTCLAFAMALSQKKTSLDKCPDVSDEAKQTLDAASLPPIATITIGTGDKKIEIGGEIFLFRHEKRFFHQTGLAVLVKDTLAEDDLRKKIEEIKALVFERVGETIGVDLIAVKNESGDKNKFVGAVRIAAQISPLPLILMSENAAALEETLKICGDKKPLIYALEEKNKEALLDLARNYACPLVVKGKDLEEAAQLAQAVSSSGVKDLVVDSGTKEISPLLQDLTQARRLALKKNYRPLGYPTVAVVDEADSFERVARASTYISKYASLLIFDGVSREEWLALITLRLNIFTDPQKPIMMEPKLYEVGSPDGNSPLLVTTNFSLTYYTVQPEIEGSNIPAYLLLTDSEGLSVLTAWAADKFNSEKIIAAMKKNGVEEKVSHRKIIIPGDVASLCIKLKEESGWEVLVGPKEASGLPKYLKETWARQK